MKATHLDKECDQIAISVTDTGIGIKDKDLQRLFVPFVQGSQDAGVKAQGTGLGLSIVKSLAERMNGAVQLESELGVGSTFTVLIRLPISLETPLTPLHHLIGSVKRPFKILLVDDDNISRKVIAKLLSKLGHDVTHVASGMEALVELKTKEYDVVLTDYSMPGVGGTELLSKAKEIAAVKRYTKFICFSGYAHKESVEERLKDGFDACFSKPLNLESFGKKLSEFSQR